MSPQRGYWLSGKSDHNPTFRGMDVRGQGLAIRERRIKALNDRHDRVWRIVEARAKDPKLRGDPGTMPGCSCTAPS
jgi:hypothetical protein